MSATRVFAQSEAELLQIAAEFSATLQFPAMVFLSGDLGAGKTTFVRGVLQARGLEGKVKSPTFSLVETYQLEDLVFHHLDLYRLEQPEELEFIGVRDLVGNADCLFIEWPEKADGSLPAPTHKIQIDYCDPGRVLHIRAIG